MRINKNKCACCGEYVFDFGIYEYGITFIPIFEANSKPLTGTHLILYSSNNPTTMRFISSYLSFDKELIFKVNATPNTKKLHLL